MIKLENLVEKMKTIIVQEEVTGIHPNITVDVC